MPRHVAIIMDGNGRWAARRQLPRERGHRAGAEAVRRVVRAARELGLPALTLYAFSAQNWGRPAGEVAHLMELLRTFLIEERAELAARGIRLLAIGDPGRLPASVRDLLGAAKRATAAKPGHDAVPGAVLRRPGGDRRGGPAAGARRRRGAPGARVDHRGRASRPRSATASCRRSISLIRTSGEQRLSNFMLWEAAYAELVFTDVLWPDFDRADLEAALAASRAAAGASA